VLEEEPRGIGCPGTDRDDALLGTAVRPVGSHAAGEDLLRAALERLVRAGSRVRIGGWYGAIDLTPPR